MKTFVSKELLESDCPICFESYNPGDKVVVLGCNKLHMFHESCYDIFTQHDEKNKKTSVCPSCRKPIDKSATTKKQLDMKKKVASLERFDSL